MQRLVEPGTKVLAGSDGAEAELTRFTVGGGCVLTFRGGNAEEEQTFTSLFGNKEGSARLRLPPPLLAPPPRETRKDDVLATVGPLVLTHAEEVCPTSPCKRDAMRRHVGPRVWETRQALILLFTIYTMFALFDAKHPGLLRLAQYKITFNEVVWHAKHAYRETCLCRTCFNKRCYREAMRVLAKILALLAKPSPREDAEGGGGDDEPEPVDPSLTKLLQFCESCDSGRRRAITEMVCADRLEDVDIRCVRGTCERCGFARLWSKGMRPKLVDAYGKLRASRARG